MTTTDDEPSLAVGDHVILRSYSRRGHERLGQVVKVGRRWATIQLDHGATEIADRQTGWGKPGYAGDSFFRALTAERWGAQDRHAALITEVAERTRGYSWAHRLTYRQLRRILDVLDGAEE